MLAKTLVTPTPESESFQLQAPRMDTWPGNTAVSQTRYGQKSGEGQGSKFPFSSPASGLPSVQVQGTWDGAHDRADAAAAAKSLQSCPTLCDPIDDSPPGSPVPGILQARTLEWVAISFSSA